tara:strand:- start:980 stop:1339 length:360 start_codon:yes stop_codon:yes gene_type:complete
MVSMIADYREGKVINPAVYPDAWPSVQATIPSASTNNLTYTEIRSLIQAYRVANYFDSRSIDQCHAKARHEELMDISLELTKQMRKAIEGKSYDEATYILKLMQEVDAVVRELNLSACK